MKPILFNTEMVRAILEGRKTVTRRVVKLPSNIQVQDNGLYTLYAEGTCYENQHIEELEQYLRQPYKVGDVLYVRETWGNYGDGTPLLYKADYPDGDTTYKHDDGIHICDLPKWKPSIHMPKAATRIFLKVSSVRVERLQDMTEEQASKEGAIDNRGFIHSPDNEYTDLHTAREDFIRIWNSTIKPVQLKYYGWEANPYVWVIEFERVEKPEAAV